MEHVRASPPASDAHVGTLSVWAEPRAFSTDALRLLLTSPLEVEGARRGTRLFSLRDLLSLAPNPQKGNASHFIRSSVPRDHARWDIHLSQKWVNQMKDVNVAFATACDMAETVRNRYCKSSSSSRTTSVAWHAMIVHPGSPDQPVHVDDSKFKVGGTRCYYTLILPLTGDAKAGGTHFPALNYTFAEYGGVLVFDGAVEHAGLGNRSNSDRVFLYAAIHSGKDEN